MGHQIIKQPDGRYLVWSTIVDDIVVYDADREEIIEWFVEGAIARERTNTKVALDVADMGVASRLGVRFADVATRLEEVREQYRERDNA